MRVRIGAQTVGAGDKGGRQVLVDRHVAQKSLPRAGVVHFATVYAASVIRPQQHERARGGGRGKGLEGRGGHLARVDPPGVRHEPAL